MKTKKIIRFSILNGVLITTIMFTEVDLQKVRLKKAYQFYVLRLIIFTLAQQPPQEKQGFGKAVYVSVVTTNAKQQVDFIGDF